MFTVASVLQDNVRFTEPVTAAMRGFARSKPFRGTIEERKEKFRTFHATMCAACEIEAAIDFNNVELEQSSVEGGSGVYRVEQDGPPVIVLSGKLSLATYLYLLGGLMGMESHAERMKWAANLFRKFFPRSFAGLRTDGPYLTR